VKRGEASPPFRMAAERRLGSHGAVKGKKVGSEGKAAWLWWGEEKGGCVAEARGLYMRNTLSPFGQKEGMEGPEQGC